MVQLKEESNMSKLTIIPLYDGEDLLNASANYIKSEGLEILEKCEITGALEYTGESKKLEKVYTNLEKVEKSLGATSFKELYKMSYNEYRKGELLAEFIIKKYL